MSGFVEKLKRKEQVEEDLYFARRDRELLQAMQYQIRSDDAVGSIQIISGGQTGVDRAALDAAAALGLPTGGWCPLGRRAEDGPIPDTYPLLETSSPDYGERTICNVRDADATLVLHRGELSGGTRFTVQIARRAARPLLVRDLSTDFQDEPILDWLLINHVRFLNCAGPRESGAPGIQVQARERFLSLFAGWTRRLETAAQG